MNTQGYTPGTNSGGPLSALMTGARAAAPSQADVGGSKRQYAAPIATKGIGPIGNSFFSGSLNAPAGNRASRNYLGL